MNVRQIATLSEKSIEAVLFDWGGTLAEYLGDSSRVSIRAAADQILASSLSAEFAEALALRIEKSWLARPNVTDTFESLVFETAASDQFADLTLVHLENFINCFLSLLAAEVKHPASAVDVLTSIRARGQLTAMLCNTIWPPIWHDGLLARDGLLSLLPVRVYSSQTFIRKPDPEAFFNVTKQLNVTPRHCVFVGDRGDEDIDGAAGVGMRTIWIQNMYSPPQRHRPDRIVNSLQDLVELKSL